MARCNGTTTNGTGEKNEHNTGRAGMERDGTGWDEKAETRQGTATHGKAERAHRQAERGRGEGRHTSMYEAGTRGMFETQPTNQQHQRKPLRKTFANIERQLYTGTS